MNPARFVCIYIGHYDLLKKLLFTRSEPGALFLRRLCLRGP
jgi:hypothetical protein